MRKLLFVLAIMIGCVTAAAPALGQPNEISLQGVLRSVGGDLVNGSYSMTVNLYAEKTSPTPLFSKTFDKVVVENGVYSLTIPFGNESPVKANPHMWVGIGVDNQPEYPRVPLSSVVYALRSTYANSAFGLDCSGCVKESMLSFSPLTQDDLGGDLVVSGSVTAAAFIGDGSGLTGISSPQGECAPGWFVSGILPDGKLVCQEVGKTITSIDGLEGGKINGDVDVAGALSVNGAEVCTMDGNCGDTLAQLACQENQVPKWNGKSWVCSDFLQAFDPAALPSDGLNEVSNDLLFNQFLDVFASTTVPVKIKDYYPPGVVDEVVVPDVGIAQSLKVSINVSNSDLSKVTVNLYAPDNTMYVLYDKNGPGTELGATYPDPVKPLSGDLTTWIGKNAKGTWRLQVIDASFNDTEFDGTINSWNITIQTLSSKKVQVKGDLYIDGSIYSTSGGLKVSEDGAVSMTGDLSVGGKITGDITHYTNPFGTVFTYWGHKNCPQGTVKLYQGAGFGGHHDHKHGNQGICVKGGDPGPSDSYEGNILYPIHTTGSKSTPPGVPPNRNLFCAVCQWEKGFCFEMWGSDTCPNGWETVYNGFAVGPHYTHHGPMGHYCLDPENGFDTSVGASGHGHLYTTRIQSSNYGGNWPSGKIVKCAMCCRK